MMVVLAFTLIYMFVPYTRVKVLPAFTGGLIAGVMWNVVGWVFAGFVSKANNYTAIYSGFATPILFMIWLYVGWLILLLGATVAFYRQHPEYLSGRQLTQYFSQADRERLVLQAIRSIGARFYGGTPPTTAEGLSADLRVPSDAIEQALHALERRGLVAASNSTPPGYLPGCPWENASVYDVLEAAHESTGSMTAKRPPLVMDEAVQAVIERRREVSQETFGALSLRELAGQPGALSPKTSAPGLS
jgi:membrane protein